jgi:hypothetical protein
MPFRKRVDAYLALTVLHTFPCDPLMDVSLDIQWRREACLQTMKRRAIR